MSMEDRSWEKIQIRAFTCWANRVVPKHSAVEDLEKDFCDGLVLVALAEALTKTKIKHIKDPKNVHHYIENCNKALNSFKNSGVKVNGYSAEDFLDGGLKPVLGFLWTLLRHFRIESEESGEDTSFEVSLLSWIRETLKDYDLKIDDFVESFADGRVLCALMSKYSENALDFSTVETQNAKENIERALKVARDEADIPDFVDPLKMASKDVEECTVVLYLSLVQQAFCRKFEKGSVFKEKESIKLELESVKQELTSVKQELTSVRQEKNSLGELNNELQSNIGEMNSIVKDEVPKLCEQNARLREELDELKKKNTQLQEKIAVMERILEGDSEEKIALSTRNKALEEDLIVLKTDKASLEDERVELRRVRDDLQSEQRSMVESMNKFKSAKQRMEASYSSSNELSLKGLEQLQKNLVEHLQNMNIWKEYLEQGKNYYSEKVQVQTEKTISNLSSEDQLQYLSDSLKKENTKLESLLAEHKQELNFNAKS